MRHAPMLILCSILGCAAAPAAGAGTLCVDPGKPHCFAAVQAAVDAAHDGDTIELGRGTFAGGITIAKSVRLVGRGPRATTVSGGGPVLTIGEWLGASTPTVSISRVTITGGLNTSTPGAAVTVGGGVWIPPSAGNATGATVTIADSVVAGNRATPVALLDPAFCDGRPCAFAFGGGIANAGTLTLVNTRIRDNVAGSTPADGSLASDAVGGGILNQRQGTLVVKRTSVTGNRAAVTVPNGRFAGSGGIANDGVLTLVDGSVSGNVVDGAAAVASTFPIDVQQEAVGGGIGVSPGATATITRASVDGNSATATNAAGDAQAVAGGIDADGTLVLVDSRVDGNVVRASVPAASGFLAGAVFGGLEVSGVATIRGSSVSRNRLHATSASGAANVAGGGIGSLSGSVVLERTRVIGNRGSADGVAGLALGGGVLSIDFGGGPPELALTDSVVTGNVLEATPGITPQGGGIFSADLFSGVPFPVALTRTVIAGNRPDQCVGC